MINNILTFIVIISVVTSISYVAATYLLPWLSRKRMIGFELPEAWERVLNTKHPNFSSLEIAEKDKVRDLIKVLMAEKYIEPDELKWDEQIMICSIIALKVFDKKHHYLSKLSTIRVGKPQNLGQGLIEVPSIDDLKNLEFKKWF